MRFENFLPTVLGLASLALVSRPVVADDTFIVAYTDEWPAPNLGCHGGRLL